MIEKMKPEIFDASDEDPDTALDLDANYHGFGPIPEKRKKRAALLSVALSFLIMVVLLGGFTRPKSKLYIIKSNTIGQDDKLLTCKSNNEHYHVGIFIWALNLIGVIFGEFMNRFCLMFEEYFHLDTRYSGSKRKMFFACFSDISFRAVLFGSLVAFIIITSTLLSQGAEYFKFEYIEIILSGVGSGSLVIYLLSFDILSRVQISSLMENNNRLVATGLAWNYYFNYLKIILPGMQTRIAQKDWGPMLSCNKLYILLPRDCYAFDILCREDRSIEIVEDWAIEYQIHHAGKLKTFRNVVYKINRKRDCPLYVLAQYAMPLCSLYGMSHSAQARLSPDDRDEQAKLFFRTLEAILQNPCEPEVHNTCKLVPYARYTEESLSQVLAEAVLKDTTCCTSSEISLDELDGFNQRMGNGNSNSSICPTE